MNNSQINLFEVEKEEENLRENSSPFANLFRPQSFDEMVGQVRVAGKNSLIQKFLRAKKIPSMLFYGPPGSGKTTLGHIIMKNSDYYTESLNSVTCSVSIIREKANEARVRKQDTIIFMDEIHRLNKGQQDVFLPFIESGVFVLIGATTENPFFYLNRPLLSRMKLFKFESLSEEDIYKIVCNIVDKLKQTERENLPIFTEKALKAIAMQADGDARAGINFVESCVLSCGSDSVIDENTLEEILQDKILAYDRDQDAHYDTISAMIKSIRGSDPDAALYWMAKMLESGEKPEFIARRLLISASEDIGLANPDAITIAVSCVQAFERVGMPEGKIILSQLCIYLCTSPKSNSAYNAINSAIKAVREEKPLDVPQHLRSSGNKGKYLYPHNYPEHFVMQNYLPEIRNFYEPCDNKFEIDIKKRLDRFWGSYPRKEK